MNQILLEIVSKQIIVIYCRDQTGALCYSIDWSLSFKVHLNNFAAEHSTRFKNNARALHAMLQIQ